MDIRCPGCRHTFEADEAGIEMICPSCNRPLEVALENDGFALVGIAADPVQPPEPDNDFADDPVVADYEQWRGRAVFIMLFGLVCALILSVSTVRGILNYGVHYFYSGKNQLFSGIFAIVAVLCIAGGFWFFRYLERERERYKTGVRGRRAESSEQ